MTQPRPSGRAIRGIHHIAISVPDLNQAKHFYTEVLGFSIVDETRLHPSADGDAVTQLNDADCTAVMVDAGNIFLELFEFHSPKPDPLITSRSVHQLGYTHFALEVEDIQAEFLRLEAEGVQWHSPPVNAGDGYMMTYGRDPFGNVIEIQQVPADLPFSLERLALQSRTG